jgi:hypothetical protein
MYTISHYNVAQIIIKTYSILLHKPSFKINLPVSKVPLRHTSVDYIENEHIQCILKCSIAMNTCPVVLFKDISW